MSQITSLAQTTHEMAPDSPSLHQIFAAPRDPDLINPAAAYLSSLGPGSRRTMRQSLHTVARLLSEGHWDADQLDWALLRYKHMLALRAYLRDRYAIRTANKMLSAVRRTLREAYLLGQMTETDFRRTLEVTHVSQRPLTPATGRMLSDSEVRALMTVCLEDEGPAGVRDGALIALMCQTGLRRSEVVALEWSDYDPEQRRFTVRASKGHVDRTVFISGGAVQIMTDWCVLRGDTPGALFVPINKGGRILLRRGDTSQARALSPHAIYKLLVKRGQQAGLESFSPHDLRRTFISRFIGATGDLSLAAQIAGHKTVETTRGYDHRGEQAKAHAPDQIHIPYQQPRILRATITVDVDT